MEKNMPGYRVWLGIKKLNIALPIYLNIIQFSKDIANWYDQNNWKEIGKQL